MEIPIIQPETLQVDQGNRRQVSLRKALISAIIVFVIGVGVGFVLMIPPLDSTLMMEQRADRVLRGPGFSDIQIVRRLPIVLSGSVADQATYDRLTGELDKVFSENATRQFLRDVE